MKINEYLNLNAFSLNANDKKYYFEKFIKNLIFHHYKNSKEYKNILDHISYDFKNNDLNKIPYLPVNIFKSIELKSIKNKEIFKVLRSSGTSDRSLSQIFLDKKNSNDQVRALSKIVSTILGKKRIPMLVIDKKPILKDRSKFDAKTAAFYGFSIFGSDHTFALDENGKLDYKNINNFLKNYGSSRFFIFGFTSSVYENLYINLDKNSLNRDLLNGILLHGGGWKKMTNIKVNNDLFKKNLLNKTGLKKIYNYYGLVEQTGSIFIECDKCSSFITSIFSDVIIRDQKLNIQKDGKKGFIQLVSLLPSSYPGHSILTEDLGEIVNNSCECSSLGKKFKVHGRIKKAEIRGCSDI